MLTTNCFPMIEIKKGADARTHISLAAEALASSEGPFHCRLEEAVGFMLAVRREGLPRTLQGDYDQVVQMLACCISEGTDRSLSKLSLLKTYNDQGQSAAGQILKLKADFDELDVAFETATSAEVEDDVEMDEGIQGMCLGCRREAQELLARLYYIVCAA